MSSAHTPARRGFALPHPSGRLRRVLVLYTGGTIGMVPSPRGYVCEPGYLPRLLGSLQMFHDPDHGLAISAPVVVEDVDSSLKSSVSSPLVTPVSEFGLRTLYTLSLIHI